MGTMLAINGNIINSQEPLPIPVNYDYLGETTGTTEIEIPEGYDEVYCDIIDSTSGTYYNTSFITDFDSRNRRGGYYFNASNYGGWIIGWDSSTRKAKLLNALSVGHDYTSTAKVKWYAMKHIMQSGGSGAGWSPLLVIHSDTGETVTATQGTTTVTAEEVSEGVYECTLPNNMYGEWDIVGVVNGDEARQTIDISTVKCYNINFINGRTVLPTDDIDILLKCASIYDSELTTIAEVLADEPTITKVINSTNAMYYMSRSTTWASTVCNDEDAMTAIGQRNESADALLTNGDWITAIGSSTYWNKILKVSPVMTSNNSPEGVVSASSYFNDGYDCSPWKGVSDADKGWMSRSYSGHNGWLQYKFIKKVRAKLVKVRHGENYSGYSCTTTQTKISASVDNSNFTQLYADTTSVSKGTIKWYPLPDNEEIYDYYRLDLTQSGDYGYYPGNREYKIYYREDV